MALYYAIAFILCAVAVFQILNISYQDIFNEIAVSVENKKMKTLSQKVKFIKKKKKRNPLIQLFLEVHSILKMSGKENLFAMLCGFSVVGCFLGIILAIVLKNAYLVPVFATAFALMPFFYVIMLSSKFRAEVNAGLETALNTITTSYLRGNTTIFQAIEENLTYLTPPLSDAFERFILETTLISSDYVAALEHLKIGIDNIVFSEWVDAVILCQSDNNLKSTVPPIVSKLSEMRGIEDELTVLITAPIRQYYFILCATLLSPFVIYFVEKNWWITLTQTQFGKILLAISLLCAFVTNIIVVRLSRTTEYI